MRPTTEKATPKQQQQRGSACAFRGKKIHRFLASTRREDENNPGYVFAASVCERRCGRNPYPAADLLGLASCRRKCIVRGKDLASRRRSGHPGCDETYLSRLNTRTQAPHDRGVPRSRLSQNRLSEGQRKRLLHKHINKKPMKEKKRKLCTPRPISTDREAPGT